MARYSFARDVLTNTFKERASHEAQQKAVAVDWMAHPAREAVHIGIERNAMLVLGR